MDQRNLYRVLSVELLNNYVRQGREREAGKQSTIVPSIVTNKCYTLTSS